MSGPKGNAEPRYIPQGSCTWCGHRPHPDKACTSKIRTDVLSADVCPCRRHDSGLPNH